MRLVQPHALPALRASLVPTPLSRQPIAQQEQRVPREFPRVQPVLVDTTVLRGRHPVHSVRLGKTAAVQQELHRTARIITTALPDTQDAPLVQLVDTAQLAQVLVQNVVLGMTARIQTMWFNVRPALTALTKI